MYSCNRWARIKEKAQVTIPREICQKLGIKKGDLFKVEVVDRKIKFTPQVLVDKT